MKERKNLENLFQERFENFEIHPSENVWENIKIELEEKKNKKRVIPFWWKLSGIAAALFIGLFIVVDNLDSNEQIITNSDAEKPATNTNLNSNAIQNSETSIAVSNQNETSESNKNVNKINASSRNVNVNSVANSDEKDALKLNLKNNIISTKSKNKIYKKIVNSTSAVAENKAENNTDNSSETSATNKTVVEKNNTKSKIKNNNNDVAVKSEKEKNTFYNYKNKTISSDEKESDKAIVSNNKKTIFNKNETLYKTNFDKIEIEKPVTNVISEKNYNENSMLNVGNKKEINSNNPDNFKSEFDKKIAFNNNSNLINNQENDLKLINNNKIDSTKIAVVEPNALEELLKEKEPKIAKEPKLNRWQVTTNVAPIYFSSTGDDGSALDSKFENNSKSYSTNYSYGVGVNYKVAKKLKIRTGVNSVSFNYNTNDLVFFQSNSISKISNVAPNELGAFIEIESKNKVVKGPILTETEFLSNKFEGSLNQKLGYLEVPLEMSYTLLDKKFSIEVVGGLSTLFLNQNEIYLESAGLKMDIGEATNLNDIHFSGNIGLGFKYGILKNLEAKVEPVFKYQMNTYTTDTGDFKPYFIGIYSGISYNF